MTATNAQLITGRPPSFTEFDKQNLIVPEGGSIDLKCPLIFDGFDIEWFKNSETLQKTGEKLNFPIVSRSDTGEYQCFASNGIGGAFSPVVNVTVLSYAENVDAFDEEDESFYTQTVSPTDYFHLQPPNLIASPFLKVSWRWLFEGQEIFINETHYISTKGDLVILKAQGHFGSYQLEADSEKGAAFSEKYSVIEGKGFSPSPDFSIVLRPKDITVNPEISKSAIFECVPSLYGRYPAEIKWFLDGKALIIDERQIRTEHSNRRLVINNVMELIKNDIHSAKIRCEAKSAEEEFIQFAEAHLEIIEKPEINRQILPSETSYSLGSSIKLECKTTKAWPRARFQWYFNKEKPILKVSSDEIKIKLKI
uniref:Ig-like domain-containing protein n=1 Tax=Panagrolaimus davidi TaxID=227884 RepID=A0A914R120_9BILA